MNDKIMDSTFRVHDPEAIIEHHHGYEARVGKETTQVWAAEDGVHQLIAEVFGEGHRAKAIRWIEAESCFHGIPADDTP